jgi:exopolyphosphatase/guanosine-5'-triphosphate,3'-diphosphate pyrophosphatase
VALSLPLGAGRLTRDRLPGDPPRSRDVAALREHVAAVAGGARRSWRRPPGRGVASKTFRSLARLDGAAPYARPAVPRALSRAAGSIVDGCRDDRRKRPLPGSRRAAPPAARRRGRRARGDAGARRRALDICPWALREGVVLRRLDWLAQSEE